MSVVSSLRLALANELDERRMKPINERVHTYQQVVMTEYLLRDMSQGTVCSQVYRMFL